MRRSLMFLIVCTGHILYYINSAKDIYDRRNLKEFRLPYVLYFTNYSTLNYILLTFILKLTNLSSIK